ncbi:hypothetical protein CCHL11_06912 [Colletotrichum chlorophyti]|uniref:Uncharacterized protein n=1 Tax=Colletotrichum chlorophyti TaxID=708187 RepID=A0A1Q8RBI1_9PEZI|nr:hypothetical protein CCHL11_06912 [Colletotrichum chlorophyti]
MGCVVCEYFNDETRSAEMMRSNSVSQMQSLSNDIYISIASLFGSAISQEDANVTSVGSWAVQRLRGIQASEGIR